jgi:hypothetical protein
MNINPGLEPLTVGIETLHTDPKNARHHDQRSIESIMSSLTEFGQQKPIIVVEGGRVIAGNGTLEAARKLGWTRIAVVTFPDEKRATAYAIADNRTAELSVWNTDQLAETLKELNTDWDLESLGFTGVEFEQLVPESKKHEPEKAWEGMPEFDQQDKEAKRQILVSFRNDEDVEKFVQLLGLAITPQTRYLWYPQTPPEIGVDKRYK